MVKMNPKHWVSQKEDASFQPSLRQTPSGPPRSEEAQKSHISGAPPQLLRNVIYSLRAITKSQRILLLIYR